MCLEDYPIHTVTGLVKQWLRELPDPLMTFMHYNDFLHAIGEWSVFHKGAALFGLFSPFGADAFFHFLTKKAMMAFQIFKQKIRALINRY